MDKDRKRRRYPRLTVDTPAVVGVRLDPRSSSEFPATIVSLSCEGAGLLMRELEDNALRNGGKMQLRFPVLGNEIELPAKVAWHTRNGQTHVGLSLMLALAPAAFRQSYAQWIVGLMRRQGLA